LPAVTRAPENTIRLVVFSKHRYYDDQFAIELYEAPTSKDGTVKSPLTAVDPLSLLWKTEKVDEVKFYTGLYKFQSNFTASNPETDMEGLKTIVKNPLHLPIYYHDPAVSEKITAGSIVPVRLQTLQIDLRLTVDLKESFYEVFGELVGTDKSYPLKMLRVRYHYFVQIDDALYLVTNAAFLRVIEFFKKNNQKILIHQSKFEEFQKSILAELEHHITIQYSYLKPATKRQIEEQSSDMAPQRMIYLSDHENFISITPVVQYGNVEIPVYSRKQIRDADQNGNVFTVERDKELELQFTAILLRQHPYFSEQILEGEFFYLPREQFLNENWFLEAFEEWKSQGILIFGFNELQDNKLNEHKAVITILVTSGIDWFNASVKVSFGKQKAALKQLYKSVRNKSKFVQLDDGTMGILPDEWVTKFASYFQVGEVAGEVIRTPKNNFSDIAGMYELEMLTPEVKEEVSLYKSKFANFESIEEVDTPVGLKATLRDYQKQGLNWLNFLDDFNFGACLADDMGLGKTIQIIAFILLQRAKQPHNTNLVVVPTSLLFNWQAEVEKFAPSIRLYANYGLNKVKNRKDFDAYEIILTTYGTLLSDIALLKEYRFNYIFLDESQAIKNPESQRYKAARMLQSRNKIVLTGTPIENNTFDIYGQLSFACPGLLGSKQQFKDLYSIPIDKFFNSKRALELQKKITPFILRRTKKQVATELPEKTEMMIYCEMGSEQRKVYDAYEQELRDYIATKKDEDLPKSSMYVLTGLTKLRQICNSSALLNDERWLGVFSSKIEVLMEQIETQSPYHKILVFSQFVTMLDLIRKELVARNIGFEYLTGQTTNRGAKVDAFQNNDSVRVFLISLKAGGTGLNLTEADYVYLVDPWWNPAVENQAIDRCYRIGQKKNVIAVRLICPDTIEEKIMKLQESKIKLAQDLIKTDGAMLKAFSKKDLLEMLK
jgi:hypothetical protein